MSWNITWMSRAQQELLADELVLRCRKVGDCLVWQMYPNTNGYGLLRVHCQQRYAHRLSYEVFGGGPLAPGLLVRHTCDTPMCIRPEHLLVGTHQENKDDSVSRGRHAHGPAHSERMSRRYRKTWKLAYERVAIIRARYAAGGVTQRQIADDEGVSRSMIAAIVRGERRTKEGAGPPPLDPSTNPDIRPR